MPATHSGGMGNEAHFQATHVALIALSWECLEQIETLLDAQVAVRTIEDHLQCLRLELLLLADRAQACAERREIEPHQQLRIHDLVQTLVRWLDFEMPLAPELVRLRVRTAQDWLLAEVSAANAVGSGRPTDGAAPLRA